MFNEFKGEVIIVELDLGTVFIREGNSEGKIQK